VGHRPVAIDQGLRVSYTIDNISGRDAAELGKQIWDTSDRSGGEAGAGWGRLS